jgi:hypothetical protein
VSPELATKLRRLNDFAYDLYKAVDKLMTSGKVPKNADDISAIELSQLKKKIDDFESEILKDMKRELSWN